MYVIRIREGDGEEEEECKKIVPVIELYKILRIKELLFTNHKIDIFELVVLSRLPKYSELIVRIIELKFC